eukprot:1181519-Prorocentrum_minimum.AAC.1
MDWEGDLATPTITTVSVNVIVTSLLPEAPDSRARFSSRVSRDSRLRCSSSSFRAARTACRTAWSAASPAPKARSASFRRSRHGSVARPPSLISRTKESFSARLTDAFVADSVHGAPACCASSARTSRASSNSQGRCRAVDAVALISTITTGPGSSIACGSSSCLYNVLNISFPSLAIFRPFSNLWFGSRVVGKTVSGFVFGSFGCAE